MSYRGLIEYHTRLQDDELMHYGILGMKWGVRRFQNYDGTLTPEGIERYRSPKFQEKVAKMPEGKIRYGGKPPNRIDRIEGVEEAVPSKKIKSGKRDDSVSKVPEEAVWTGFQATSGLINLGLVAYQLSKGVTLGQIMATNPWMIPLGGLNLGMAGYKIAKERQSYFRSKKYAKERQSEPIDEKTGLPLKTHKLSEKEDLKRVNPDFGDMQDNSKGNCQLCTVTYELRRRGYDVSAGKTYTGFFNEDIPRWFPNVKTYKIERTKTETDLNDTDSYVNRVVEILEKQPEGARGNLGMFWGGYADEKDWIGAHSVMYEIKDGRLRIIDAQSAKVYENPKRYLRDCNKVTFARYDNLKFDKNGIKEVIINDFDK